VLGCLETCGLAVSLPPRLTAATWDEVDVVRRIRNGALREVLPVSIGDVVIVDEITEQEFLAAVGALAARVPIGRRDVVIGSS
jgi:3-dehydroquinate synthase